MMTRKKHPRSKAEDIRGRLSRVAKILDDPASHPDTMIYRLGLRLLDQELADIEFQTHLLEVYEMENFHSMGPPIP